jgi:hypothetical protein
MISSSSFFQPVDNDTKRRCALANVYEFLLKLAEEKNSSPNALPSEQEAQNELAPLKKNIPS